MPGLPNIQPNIAYLKTPQAILKIVQIVTLLIAFSCITDCCDGGNPYTSSERGYGTSYNTIHNKWADIVKLAYPQEKVTGSDISNYNRNTSFFLAVTIFGWLLVVFFFAFFFLRFHERFKQIDWEMVEMIISIVWSVLLLLCCSLMGSISSTALRATGMVTRTPVKSPYVNTMVTGVVFGFFSLIAFVVDAALKFREFWSKRKAGGHDNGSTNNPVIHKVSEAPGPSALTAQDQIQTQVPPTQKFEAPPRYDAVLPGQMPNTAGQTVPYAAGGQAAVVYPSGQQYPTASGQQYPTASGQQYPTASGQQYPTASGQQYPTPSGQQYQTASGQPVMWQMA